MIPLENKQYQNKIVKAAGVIVVLAVIIGIVIAIFSPKKDKKPSRYVVGYLPYYSSAAADRIDYSALTHLNIAFANPDASGTLTLEMSEDTIRGIVTKCHKNDVKVMLSLGGGSVSSTNYNALMRGNPKGITAFNRQIMEFCEKYEFDGVDVDFEFIASSPAWEYFEDWITALKKQCDKHHMILSAAVATWYSDNMSDAALDCFEYLTVMAYDNDGDGENHSKYEYAVHELEYYEKQGIAKNRLVLGVPFYGYRYTSSGAMDWSSAVSYRYLLSLNKNAAKSDYYEGYAYNGRETIRKKAELSKEYGGIMIWELSQDAEGKDSLLSVIDSVYR